MHAKVINNKVIILDNVNQLCFFAGKLEQTKQANNFIKFDNQLISYHGIKSLAGLLDVILSDYQFSIEQQAK